MLRLFRRNEQKPPASIGPHEGRELQLMLAGMKPLALVSNSYRWSPFDKAVATGQLIAASVQVPMHQLRRDLLGRLFGLFEPGLAEVRFYALPQHEARLRALCEIYAHPRPAFGEFQHATIGWLLGYTDVEIAAFLDHWQCQPIA